jgi:hypothetical protein
LCGEKSNRLDEHQRPIFANSEIDAQRAHHGAPNLHSQSWKAIKRFAELVGILAETVINEPCSAE